MDAQAAFCPPPRSAHEAHEFFTGQCGVPACPRCGATEAYALRSGRSRCPDCGYTFHRFSLRFINRGGLPPEYWHAILHYFEQGLAPQEAADRLCLTYATVFKAYATIRFSLMSLADEWRGLLDDKGDINRHCPSLDNAGQDDTAGERPLCATCRSPVIGVRQLGGHVLLRPLSRLAAQDVFHMPLSLKTWRTLVYTEPFQDFTGLLFCCCRTARTLFQAKFTRERLDMDDSSFHSFAESWFARWHCLSPANSLAYLREIEIRFNNRHARLYPVLAQALCSLVSKRED